MNRLVSFSLLALVLAACGDDDETPGIDAAPPVDGGADAGVDGGTPFTDPGIGLAVVNSDYVATSISLVDPTTLAVKDADCVKSGDTPPASTLALSGDVSLPSAPQPGNPLVAVDHANSTLTWIDPATCTPTRQLDVSTGFYANPYDLVAISASKAYVTRYEKNATPTPAATDFDEGDDLLVIDPSVPSITKRIGLSSYAVQVEGATIQARPSRALLANGKLWVALENLSADFKSAGHGRVVIVDPATDEVAGVVDIVGLKSCGHLSYDDATKTLVVQCGGSFYDADQAAGSGLAFIDTSASPPVEFQRQTVVAFGNRALAGFAIADQGGLGFAVTGGTFDDDPTDQLWLLDVPGATAVKLADSAVAFTFHGPLVDHHRKRVFLPDGNERTPRLQVFQFGALPATLVDTLEVNAGIALPTREIAWY